MSDSNASTPTVEEQVNTLVSQMIENPDFTPGEDVDPTLLFAAKTEKRRRDTQSEYTKSQQKLKSLEVKEQKLAEKLEAVIMESVPLKQRADLEELKQQDPEAWRTKLQELEATAKGDLAKELDAINAEAGKTTELERRTQVLADFQKSNPDLKLDDDVIENDIPPRITRQLEKGEISFEDFLEKCKHFLTSGKVVDKGEQAPGYADLAEAAGGSVPGADDTDEAANADYANEVY